jgi:hypothetical protein
MSNTDFGGCRTPERHADPVRASAQPPSSGLWPDRSHGARIAPSTIEPLESRIVLDASSILYDADGEHFDLTSISPPPTS